MDALAFSMEMAEDCTKNGGILKTGSSEYKYKINKISHFYDPVRDESGNISVINICPSTVIAAKWIADLQEVPKRWTPFPVDEKYNVSHSLLPKEVNIRIMQMEDLIVNMSKAVGTGGILEMLQSKKVRNHIMRSSSIQPGTNELFFWEVERGYDEFLQRFKFKS